MINVLVHLYMEARNRRPRDILSAAPISHISFYTFVFSAFSCPYWGCIVSRIQTLQLSNKEIILSEIKVATWTSFAVQCSAAESDVRGELLNDA